MKFTTISCSECMHIIREFARHVADKKYHIDELFTDHMDTVHGNGNAGSGEEYFLNKVLDVDYDEIDCETCKKMINADETLRIKSITDVGMKLGKHIDRSHKPVYKSLLQRKNAINQYLAYMVNVEIKKIRRRRSADF